MNFLPHSVSPEFFATLLAAFALLVVHAWRTHGGLFAAIWLGLTGILGVVTERALAYFSAEKRPSWSHDYLSPEALLFFSLSFYLAALFSKGLVERTRFAGSPWVFATGSALAWLPFGWSWEASTRVTSELKEYLAGCCVCDYNGETRERALGFVMTDEFLPTFGIALFLFALSYRLVSLRTPDNRVKLKVLSIATPLIALLAAWIGNSF